MLTVCQSCQGTNPDTSLGPHGADDVIKYRVLYRANSSHDTSDSKGDFTVCLFKSKTAHVSKFLYDWNLKILNIFCFMFVTSISHLLQGALPNWLSQIWFLLLLIIAFTVSVRHYSAWLYLVGGFIINSIIKVFNFFFLIVCNVQVLIHPEDFKQLEIRNKW